MVAQIFAVRIAQLLRDLEGKKTAVVIMAQNGGVGNVEGAMQLFLRDPNSFLRVSDRLRI